MRGITVFPARSAGLATLGLWLFAASGLGQTGGEGEALFQANCAACHSLGNERRAGPGLAGVTERREREWLVSFITEPDRLIAERDSLALDLLSTYGVPMPNLGLGRSQAEQILGFLAASQEGAREPAAPAERVGGDAALGRLLFTGERRLANGGSACIACHSVPGLGALGGGTLAKDLTGAAARYGASLPQVLETAPFPLMQDIFAARPLTRDEAADLSTYLRTVGESPPATPAGVRFVVAGSAGMILLLVLAALVWRGRLRGVREPLIGERQ